MSGRQLKCLGILVPSSIQLGSMSLIPPTTCLVTPAHPLAIHVLHSIIGFGGPATTASVSATARKFLVLFPLLAAIGTDTAFLLVALPCCFFVPYNLSFIMWLLAVRK